VSLSSAFVDRGRYVPDPDAEAETEVDMAMPGENSPRGEVLVVGFYGYDIQFLFI
jgi:hypothetical protein